MTIKDIEKYLKEGKSEEDIIASFQKDLDKAKDNVEQEKAKEAETAKKEAEMNILRYKAVSAVNDYSAALGADKLDDKRINEICDQLKKAETRDYGWKKFWFEW